MIPASAHDVAHFIVENELQIFGGVFGQNRLPAARRKSPRKAKKLKAEIAAANKKDALFSEHAIHAAQSRWKKHDIIPDTKIPLKPFKRSSQSSPKVVSPSGGRNRSHLSGFTPQRLRRGEKR
jgi:hypothetical protein